MPQLLQEYLSIKWKMPMNEYELVYLAKEQNEDALLLLYQSYQNLIDILLLNNKKYIADLDIDTKEIYSICLTKFNDAIEKYDENSNATFNTFVTAILKKTVFGYIYKQKKKQLKTKFIKVEYDDNIYNIECSKEDPLNNVYILEKVIDLDNNVKKYLSSFEYKVYNCLKNGLTYQQIAKKLSKNTKQIDNAIQRIKNKLKKLEID